MLILTKHYTCIKSVIVPLEVPYNLDFAKLKSAYFKGIKSTDVMGVVQYYNITFTSLFNTITQSKLKFQ